MASPLNLLINLDDEGVLRISLQEVWNLKQISGCRNRHVVDTIIDI
jgi:hypothetical protein